MILPFESVDNGDANKFMIVEATRLLDTEDSQDRPIIWDGDVIVPPHRVIAAWGDHKRMSYHGSSRSSGAIRFHPTSTEDNTGAGLDSKVFFTTVNNEAEGYIDVAIQNYQVPAQTTKYESVCVALSGILAQNLPSTTPFHIIGFEPLITTTMPHHMVLYGSTNDRNPNANCRSMVREDALKGWAVGGGPTLLPGNVGLPLGPGGDNGYISFRLSIHYDNRHRISGVVDNSGFRLHYTSKLREHSLALLLVGDPLIKLIGQGVVGENSTSGLGLHKFDCPADCTETSFSAAAVASSKSGIIVPQEINVVSELLHMHETGARMVNRIVRNGQAVHEGVIDYWDVQSSGLFPVQHGAYQIRPGDLIETECYFDESQSTLGLQEGQHVTFGTGSQEEMCIGFLFYYPKIEGFASKCGLSTGGRCTANYMMEDLASVGDFDRAFGNESKSKSARPTDRPTIPPEAISSSSQRLYPAIFTTCLCYMLLLRWM